MIVRAYRWMDMHCDETGDPAIAWTVDHRHLDTAIFSHVACDGKFHARIQTDAHTQAERKIVLICVEDGIVEFHGPTRHATCGRASLLLMNVGRRIELAQNGLVDLYTVAMPTHLWSVQCPQIEDLCGIGVSAQTGLALILHDMVKGVCREIQLISPADSQALSAVITNLVSRVFLNGPRMAPEEVLTRDYLLRLKIFVDENIQDSSLCPQKIADHLGISRSYLFQVARKSMLSIGQYIIDRRLDFCREVLVDQGWRSKSITEIAYTWGFNDLSHFSRRFSERFGCSPRAHRETGRGVDGIVLAGKTSNTHSQEESSSPA